MAEQGPVVVDGDGHVVEQDRELFEYLEEPYRGNETLLAFPFFPTLDGYQRGAIMARLGIHKNYNITARVWLDFLDEARMESTVLYPTAGLGYALIQDPDWAVALARAYNDWLYHRYLKVAPQFKGMALIPIHRPQEAARELQRAVEELGMLGAVLPAANVLFRGYGHPDFDPIFDQAQRLDCVLAVHGAPSKGFGFDFFDTFIKTHTLEHPFALMIQFTSMIFDGVLERFPGLRVAFLEAGIGWVLYMMDRMDEEYERRGKRWCPSLTKSPSEYIRGGNLYFTCEVEERLLPAAVELLGDDYIMFASDYPHERDRGEFLDDIPSFVRRADLSETTKEKILFHNARRFYKLEVD